MLRVCGGVGVLKSLPRVEMFLFLKKSYCGLFQVQGHHETVEKCMAQTGTTEGK